MPMVWVNWQEAAASGTPRRRAETSGIPIRALISWNAGATAELRELSTMYQVRAAFRIASSMADCFSVRGRHLTATLPHVPDRPVSA